MKMCRIVPAGVISMLIGLSVFTGAARAEDLAWQTDFEAAKAQAKAEKKMMLVDFTGSDWCGFCIKLRDEVFEKEPFKNDLSKQFVLVELDFPREKKLPEELKAQNAKLKTELKVSGFPTICLMDGEGQLIAKFVGYGPGTAVKYLARMADVPKVWESVLKMKAELANAQGLDRAKLLDQLVDAYEKKLSNPIDELETWGKEIIALDADNQGGLKNKYECRAIVAEAEELGKTRKFAEAVAALDKALALQGLAGDLKQQVLFKQGMFQFNAKDFAAALAAMKKAADADAEGELAAQIKSRIAVCTMIVDGQAKIAKQMEEIEKAEGLDRAKLLDALIQANTRLQMYGAAKATPAEVAKWTAEIVDLDADNGAGLKGKYEFTKFLGEATALAREKKFEEGLAAIDKALALADITPQKTQEGLMAKGLNYLMQKDFDKGLDCFKQALDAAPQGSRASLIKMYMSTAERMKKAAEQPKKDDSKPNATL
ncbi:MAG: thioredoxin family protein [Pirellulales bacterium]|nr:thioredoxin family protein [Pirellulales bacterium]